MANKNNKHLPRAAAIALALLTATPAGADGWGTETAYPVAVLKGSTNHHADLYLTVPLTGKCVSVGGIAPRVGYKAARGSAGGAAFLKSISTMSHASP